MSGDILGSQRVHPSRLLSSGFTFAFPSIEGALRAALR
jgi:NAD dependent epimerase/dehydratase family enzyme